MDNLSFFTVIMVVSALFLGGGLVFLILRFRDYYISRVRRVKYKQMISFGKRKLELREIEIRTSLEAEFRAWKDGFLKKDAAAEASRTEAECLRAEASKQLEEIQKLKEETLHQRQESEVERIRRRDAALRAAVLTPAEARKIVLEEVRRECDGEIARLRQDLVGTGEEGVRAEARRVIVDAMQRIALDVAQEACVAIVPIPSEEMKGRLIGREGRNIKSFEQVTGTTLLVDDTPGSVLVSSFDPVRREIARLALEALIRDGRIHPVSIEDFVEKARGQVLASASELGAAAVRDLDILPPGPVVTSLLGRLHFRLSVNQNTLVHSIEVARLAGLIATELGLDPIPAKRAGLFHDIGKAMDADECDRSHALAGARILKQGDEDPRVVNAVAAHHAEEEPISIYAPIIVLADKISAARPGARTSSLDGYVERMKNLEDIARSFPGVAEAYAVMAGREMRVSVFPEKLTDEEAKETARKIRARIEDELQYPGTIRITLIREQRFQEEAR